MGALAGGVKARRAHSARRSDEFFADAGHHEADYLGRKTGAEKP